MTNSTVLCKLYLNDACLNLAADNTELSRGDRVLTGQSVLHFSEPIRTLLGEAASCPAACPLRDALLWVKMFILLISLALTNSFAASNMTLEVKQRLLAAAASGSTSASSSGSLSTEEAIDLLLELLMFVVDTIDETIDNITISIDNLAEVSNAHSSLLENLTAAVEVLDENIDSLGNTTNSNTNIINDNFDAVKYWFIIVGVVSFFLFLSTWIAIIVLFCRNPMRGWRGAEARPMTSYSTA